MSTHSSDLVLHLDVTCLISLIQDKELHTIPQETNEVSLLQMHPLLPQQIDQTSRSTHQNVNSLAQHAMLRLGGFSTPHAQYTMYQSSIRCKHVLRMTNDRKGYGIERLCRLLHKGKGKGKRRRHIV